MERNWCVGLFVVAGTVIALVAASVHAAGSEGTALLQAPPRAVAIQDMDNASELDAHQGARLQIAQEDYDLEDDDIEYLDNETEV